MDGDINEAQFDAAAVHDTNLLSCPIPAVAIPTSYYLAICLSSPPPARAAEQLHSAAPQNKLFILGRRERRHQDPGLGHNQAGTGSAQWEYRRV